MNSFIAFYVFVFGLCIGSFLNVVILRGLSGEDFVFTRSKCPKCQKQLRWYMNIPLLSYIFLRGKCAYCKEKISPQYFIVELITGCLFLLNFFIFGLTLKMLFMCLFFSLFIALATTDILETVIIDVHAYILFAFSLIYAALNVGDISFLQALAGAIFGFLFFEIFARLGYLIANFRIFGEGDSLIALGLGGIFGIKNFLIIFALSVLIQSVFAIPVLIKRSLAQNNKRMALSYFMIFLSIIIVVLSNYFNLINNFPLYAIVTALVIAVLLWCLKNIFNSIKNKKELDFEEAKDKFTLFPFGPALIISAFIGIFYIEQIKIAIKMFLY